MQCWYISLKDGAPDIVSRTVPLIWYQGQFPWYDIKESAPDMISRTVSLIWHQAQCAWYDIKDSFLDMTSSTVNLIYQGQWTWYDIKDSAPDMVSRTVRLIYQGQWTWYIKDSALGMTSRTVRLIWYQGQCAWYNIKVNNSSFHPARKNKVASVGTPPSVMLPLQFSHVHFYLHSICVHPPGRLICLSIDYRPRKAVKTRGSLSFVTESKRFW
jgi:uncharacterized protein YbaR (Trm112 family)